MTTNFPDQSAHAVVRPVPGSSSQRGVVRGPGNRPLSARTVLVIHGFALSLLAALMLFRAEGRVDDERWASDGWQYAGLAFNLYKYGAFSLSQDDRPRPEPTAYREPVPSAVLAAMFFLDPAISRDTKLDELKEGPLAERIKRYQFIWLIAIAAGGFWLTRRITGSLVAAYATFLLCGFSSALAQYVNTTSTELPAAFLLVLGCLQLHRTAEKPTMLNGVALGAVFALLALTRASFLYFLPFLLVALLCFRWMRLVPDWRRAVALAAVVLAGFFVPVGGWALRNLAQFDSFSITQRGGSVLLFRANMNGMNDDEFRGSFFAYARNSWLRNKVSALSGFSANDLEEDGRLARLNRKFDFSFYQRGRAAWGSRRNEYQAQGYADYAFRGDREIRNEAMRTILADPLAHLRATLVVGWRALFMERGNGPGMAVLTFFYVISLFVVPIVGFVARQWPLVLIALPPGFLFCFTALLTHGLPRYNQPILPMLTVLSVVLTFSIVHRFGATVLVHAQARMQRRTSTDRRPHDARPDRTA